MLNKLPLEGLATLLIVMGFLVATFQATGETADSDKPTDLDKPADLDKPSASADSDGKVPIKKACYDKEQKQSWAHRQAYRNDSGELTRMEVTIYVDMCELRDLGAGPQDVKNFIKHERAHADGWMHGDGTPETNAAYYPSVEITGR